MSVVVSDAPLAFRTPPGWPDPTPEWVAGHQGWVPPKGWVPAPGVQAVPAGWVFWFKNRPAWNALVDPMIASAKRSIWIGLSICALGVLFTSIAYSSTQAGGGYVIFWGAIIWGPIQAIRAIVRLRRIEDTMMKVIAMDAPRLKAKLDQTAYHQYLINIGKVQ